MPTLRGDGYPVNLYHREHGLVQRNTTVGRAIDELFPNLDFKRRKNSTVELRATYTSPRKRTYKGFYIIRLDEQGREMPRVLPPRRAYSGRAY